MDLCGVAPDPTKEWNWCGDGIYPRSQWSNLVLGSNSLAQMVVVQCGWDNLFTKTPVALTKFLPRCYSQRSFVSFRKTITMAMTINMSNCGSNVGPQETVFTKGNAMHMVQTYWPDSRTLYVHTQCRMKRKMGVRLLDDHWRESFLVGNQTQKHGVG